MIFPRLQISSVVLVLLFLILVPEFLNAQRRKHQDKSAEAENEYDSSKDKIKKSNENESGAEFASGLPTQNPQPPPRLKRRHRHTWDRASRHSGLGLAIPAVEEDTYFLHRPKPIYNNEKNVFDWDGLADSDDTTENAIFTTPKFKNKDNQRKLTVRNQSKSSLETSTVKERNAKRRRTRKNHKRVLVGQTGYESVAYPPSRSSTYERTVQYPGSVSHSFSTSHQTSHPGSSQVEQTSYSRQTSHSQHSREHLSHGHPQTREQSVRDYQTRGQISHGQHQTRDHQTSHDYHQTRGQASHGQHQTRDHQSSRDYHQTRSQTSHGQHQTGDQSSRGYHQTRGQTSHSQHQTREDYRHRQYPTPPAPTRFPGYYTPPPTARPSSHVSWGNRTIQGGRYFDRDYEDTDSPHHTSGRQPPAGGSSTLDIDTLIDREAIYGRYSPGDLQDLGINIEDLPPRNVTVDEASHPFTVLYRPGGRIFGRSFG